MSDDLPEGAEPLSFRSAIFEAEGVIDGVTVRARTVGGGLVMDTLVRQRAERLVDMAEVFALPGEPVRYTASLTGGDMATLLTVLRSFDHIWSFTADFERPTFASDTIAAAAPASRYRTARGVASDLRATTPGKRRRSRARNTFLRDESTPTTGVAPCRPHDDERHAT